MTRPAVLIVDDNRDLAEALRDGLDDEGYMVTTASSAEDGLTLFQSADFDLVLMDIKLPGIDGIGGLIEILNLKPEARVVVMSGYKVETLLDESIRRGALAVLQKPFSVEQVLELIREL